MKTTIYAILCTIACSIIVIIIEIISIILHVLYAVLNKDSNWIKEIRDVNWKLIIEAVKTVWSGRLKKRTDPYWVEAGIKLSGIMMEYITTSSYKSYQD